MSMSMINFGGRSVGAVFEPHHGQSLGAVIICHERYGLVQHTLDLAERLSADGYLAVAPDFLSHWDGDKEAVKRGDLDVDVEDEIVQEHLLAAKDFVSKNYVIEPQRTAVMGVCMSGSYPFLAVDVIPGLGAAVMFYGGAGDDDVSEDRQRPYSEILPKMTCPVLGVWGEDDHVISYDQVKRLRNMLEVEKISYEFTIFPRMPHGWLNSTMPGRYRPREAEQAWAQLLSFIGRAFAGEFEPQRQTASFVCSVSRDYDFSRKVRLA